MDALVYEAADAGGPWGGLRNAAFSARMNLHATNPIPARVDWEVSARQAQALKAVEDAQHALEDAGDPTKAQAAAKEELAAAQKDLEEADRQLRILTKPPAQEAIDQAYANLLMAEKKLNDTLKTYRSIEHNVKRNPKTYLFFESRHLYQRILNSLELKKAQDQRAYEESLKRYNNLKAPADPDDVALAQAAVELAKAQVAQAERHWERVKDGASPVDLAVLEASLADAQRELERWRNGPNPDEVTAARARVEAAQAALSLPVLEPGSIEAPVGEFEQPEVAAWRPDDPFSIDERIRMITSDDGGQHVIEDMEVHEHTAMPGVRYSERARDTYRICTDDPLSAEVVCSRETVSDGGRHPWAVRLLATMRCDEAEFIISEDFAASAGDQEIMRRSRSCRVPRDHV